MPEFVEWMMGMPPGWTDGPARTHRLRMLGNAVVPHQAALAMRLLLGHGGHLLEPPSALLPTATTMDSRPSRTTHAAGNPTLQGALTGIGETDAARHGQTSQTNKETPSSDVSSGCC